MAVAHTLSPNLAPWWTEAKCRSHQPYPSHAAAMRAAELHPISIRFCPKCADGYRIEPFRCHSDPTHWHCGHGRKEATPMLPSPAPMPSRRKLVGSARPPAFTDEQAREIWRLVVQQKRPKNVVAHEFKAKWWTIHQIAEGQTYRVATEALRNGTAEAVQEDAVQIITPPTMLDPNGTIAHEERTLLAMAPTPDTALLTDLADAVEVLLECREKPLPKFVSLDVAAIRALVERARSTAP